MGEHSDSDSFAGLSYAVGGDLRFPIIGSVFVGGRWICVVYMFCWGFVYGGWRLSFSTSGGISLEGGWSSGLLSLLGL